jgi:limonene-1,2-epoxide hydrolase
LVAYALNIAITQDRPDPAPEVETAVSERTACVRRFIEAWKSRDLDRIMGFFSDDCVYHNMPLDPVTGSAAIRAALHAFVGAATQIDWELHQIAENEAGVVLTERTDRFEIGGRWIALPVMGAFELRDGKIARWRDYFDMSQFMKQLPVAP